MVEREWRGQGIEREHARLRRVVGADGRARGAAEEDDAQGGAARISAGIGVDVELLDELDVEPGLLLKLAARGGPPRSRPPR